MRSLITSTLTPDGMTVASFGSAFLMLSTVSMTFAPGCLKTTSSTQGLPVGPCADLRILRPGDGVAHVGNADRRALLIGEDDVVIILGLHDLVVGGDREALLCAVQRALGGVGRACSRERPGHLQA